MQNQTSTTHTLAPTIPCTRPLTRRAAFAGLGLAAAAATLASPATALADDAASDSADATDTSDSTVNYVVSPTNEQYSLVGFIAWMLERDDLTDEQVADLERASELLETFADAIDADDADDAVAVGCVATSLSIIMAINSYRASDDNFEGYEDVLTNFTMLAGSAYTADVSINAIAHVSSYTTFASSENLAWGYSNPLAGWYVSEKKVFDAAKAELGYSGYLTSAQVSEVTAAATSTVGHYTNLFFATEQLAGVGYTYRQGDAGYTPTSSYNAATLRRYSGYATYTADEMYDLLATYCATMVRPVYRLYNPYSGEHHFTIDSNEHDTLVSVGWTSEGIAWYAPYAGENVYRLYNPYSGDHHYTTDSNEYESLAALGWNQEGTAFLSVTDTTADGVVPVYRLYNPYAEAFYHHYTTDSNERDTLVGLGWESEGIGWYAVEVD